MRVAFSRIALNTALRSPGELLMIWSTSAVAVSRSRASSTSKVRRSSCFCRRVTSAIGVLRALGLVGRCPFVPLPPRRCMCPLWRIHDDGQSYASPGICATSALGHKQTCAAQKGMSALPPKATSNATGSQRLRLGARRATHAPFHLGRVAARRGEMNMEISGAWIGELPFDCLF